MGSNREELSAQLMDDIDPELLEFIQLRVNTFIKWDLVQFFHRNPHTTDLPNQIAQYIGRDPRIVGPELKALATSGVLHEEELQGMRIYTLTPDDDMRERIARFMQACEDRQFRLKAIYHVIKGLH
ncbi:MAG: hypothetical protein HY862_03330 [Chloroflexi bacterium]|nr:hypothetical protein [Chloroflexota bacterium]